MTLIAPSPRTRTTAPGDDKAARFVGLMTVAEYHEFDKSEASGGQRAEYEDGKVFYVPGSHHEHNRIKLVLTSILFTFAEMLGAKCEAFDSDQKVRIRPGWYVYPDATIVDGVARFDTIDALQNPCAVFEVLSPSTQDDDKGSKFEEYKRIETLRHYVLVEQLAVLVTHYEKANDGTWGEPTVYADLADTLTLTLGSGDAVAVPLSRVYKRVFPAS